MGNFIAHELLQAKLHSTPMILCEDIILTWPFSHRRMVTAL